MKVWVNGSFDVLHIGHIRLLEFAAKHGTVRVGIDTDERIRSFKGSNRPYNNLQDRMDFIRAIKYVDSVISFGTNEELEDAISEWNTEIMVIGNDYANKKIIGSHIPERIIFFDRVPNKSTTEILSYENTGNR
jgi:D-beta-D-heptose 7-phosphate kinase/D-beta-D-heptose 1-phosphate adenosyltransferase